MRAVSGGGPRPDDRGGLITEFVERTRPTNPQRDRGRQIAPRGLRFRPDPAASGPKAHLIQQAATALLATAPLAAALRIAALLATALRIACATALRTAALLATALRTAALLATALRTAVGTLARR